MKNHSARIKKASLFFVFVFCFLLFCSLLHSTGLRVESAIAENPEKPYSQLHYGDGSIYEGETIDGSIRNGVGTYTWNTGNAAGASYTGQWVQGQMTGSGELILPGIGVYKGQFVNNKRQGKGVFVWTYQGEPQTGAPVSFEGNWDNDKIGTQGTLVIAGLGTYTGSFSKQKRTGKGIFTWNDGSSYNGEWANDQISGNGVYTLADGTVLSGKFQRGILSSGIVTYTVANGVAVRNVTAGKAQPDVKVTYADGTVLEGKTKGNSFTGNVTITYANKDKYVGAVKNGLKHGKGTYTWRSGAHYVGDWSNDLMSGTGKYYYGKSEKDTYLTGTFLSGKPNGTLTYVAGNKLKYKTVWKNGAVTSITYTK